MRVAVLDIGTNTFNLIIAQSDGNAGFRILYNEKLPVKLGEGGINNREITQSAFNRGIKAIEDHYNTIQIYKADKIYAFGTSALRTARNSKDFIDAIKKINGIEVEIITGDREAELIYYGVVQTLKMTPEKYLILDIGGGSNEFIIANNHEIFWKKSYPIGIARLIEKFKPSDPIKQSEIIAIEEYFYHQLEDLIRLVKTEKITTLIGASGSFETFVAMIHSSDDDAKTQTALIPQSIPISENDFNALYEKLIKSTTAERYRMKGLESMRIEMIVLACLFVKFTTKTLGIKTIIQSNFSLKEGAVYQLLNH
jgi:exopolyphosphatase / guanosine-5'-triphosphate,3'-diphosphate pyrophosphatase